MGPFSRIGLVPLHVLSPADALFYLLGPFISIAVSMTIVGLLSFGFVRVSERILPRWNGRARIACIAPLVPLFCAWLAERGRMAVDQVIDDPRAAYDAKVFLWVFGISLVPSLLAALWALKRSKRVAGS